jgi:hypothetical protein
MLSIGLWRCYINITITILDIIHRPVLFKAQRFGDWILTRLQMKPTQLSPIDRDTGDRCLLYPLGPTEHGPPEEGDRIQYPKSCSLNKIGRWIMSSCFSHTWSGKET